MTEFHLVKIAVTVTSVGLLYRIDDTAKADQNGSPILHNRTGIQ
jgi:hypothetical protein